jgi:CheY-like chemotaxis protein
MTTLTGLRVLLVEDEALVALMAEDMLDELGVVVVAVAGTLSDGLAVVGNAGLQLDGAVLDVNLGGETVYPVAAALTARGVPFIFATGYDPRSITAEFSNIPVLSKPYQERALEACLTAAFARPQAS